MSKIKDRNCTDLTEEETIKKRSQEYTKNCTKKYLNSADNHDAVITDLEEKTPESPWTARRSNQSILKEISPGISLEGMMLKLKLQYFGHLMRKVDSLEKILMLGGIGGRRRRG